MLGKLSWDAIPWDQPIPLVAAAVIVTTVLVPLLTAWTARRTGRPPAPDTASAESGAGRTAPLRARHG